MGSGVLEGEFGVGPTLEKRPEGHRLVFCRPGRNAHQPARARRLAKRTVRAWQEADVGGLMAEVEREAAVVVGMAEQGPSVAVDYLSYAINTAVDTHVPLRRIRVRLLPDTGFLNATCHAKLRSRGRRWKEYRSARSRFGKEALETQAAWRGFQTAHHAARKVMRRERREQFRAELADAATPRAFWSVVNKARGAGKASTSCLPSPDALAAHFARVFQDAASHHQQRPRTTNGTTPPYTINGGGSVSGTGGHPRGPPLPLGQPQGTLSPSDVEGLPLVLAPLRREPDDASVAGSPRAHSRLGETERPIVYGRKDLLSLRPEAPVGRAAQPPAAAAPTGVQPPVPLPPEHEPETEPVCTEAWVFKAWSQLRTRIGGGVDGLNGRLASLLQPVLLRPVAAIINGVMRTGEWPSQWKQGRVTAVPKTLDAADDPAAYRPICILPYLSKLGERWLGERLQEVYTPSRWQFGFKAGSGVADAQAAFQMEVAEMLLSEPRPRGVAILSVDVAKAFDSIDHDILHRCLQDLRCPPSLLRVLHCYVRGRRCFVRTEEGDSADFDCPTGVPQGSRLGPTLYSLYSEAVLRARVRPGSRLICYADDTILVAPWLGEQSRTGLQSDTDALAASFTDLGLRLNGSKSRLLFLHLNNCAPPSLNIQLAGAMVEEVEVLRWLGVFWDSRGLLDDHFNRLHTRGKQIAYSGFNTFGRYVSPHCFWKLWRSLGESLGSWSWQAVQPRTGEQVRSLERMERHAARLATATSWTTPYETQLEQLGAQPAYLRTLAIGFGFCLQLWAGIRLSPVVRRAAPRPPQPQSRRNPSRLARPQTSTEWEDHWTRHPFQLADPTRGHDHCVRLRTLPFLRILRLWNSVILTPEEEERLRDSPHTAPKFLKQVIADVADRSTARFTHLYPAWKPDLASL